MVPQPIKLHSFPAFYACYLLKSVKTPKSTSTYIGSTPNPPKRIRQHNGEIAQGAFKTSQNRPWVMQMIICGFPSKLAALQFEWAWQHPYRSRHLRDTSGQPLFMSGRRNLKKDVLVAKTMVAAHPYNMWPLHIKFFTSASKKAWDEAIISQPLPVGMTFTEEYEGVDGRSRLPGSGRVGPIDVTDGKFSVQHMQKSSSIRNTLRGLECTICSKPVENYRSEPLKAALCPSGDCLAVSHLLCLANDFLSSDPSQCAAELLPRGGNCKSCRSYVLWGDVIRGCYRRYQGGKAPQLEESDHEEDSIEAEARSDDPAEVMIPTVPVVRSPTKAARSRVTRSETTKRPRGRPPKKNPSSKVATDRAPTVTENDSEAEVFGISGFTDLDDSESEAGRQLLKPNSVRGRK